MKNLLLLILFFTSSAFAQINNSYPQMKRWTGFVPVRQNVSLYADYIQGQPGKPVVVLLNGMTYSTEYWGTFAKSLYERGFGILRYDPVGMGKTLLKHGPIREDIPFAQQVFDLQILLRKLKIPMPYNLVGLSYGGALAMGYGAQFPREVGKIIALAPYTQPVVNQDLMIKLQIQQTRIMFPFNPATDDELYNYFLRQAVYTTFPMAEPSVLENPYKLEATFRLAKGIKDLKAVDLLNKFPKGSLHLVVGEYDQYINSKLLVDFWAKVPTAARASFFFFNKAPHKLTERYPIFAASWVEQILLNNPVIRNGQKFVGEPFTGEVTFPGGKFVLPK